MCHKEAEDAEAEEAGGTYLKTRTPHKVVGKKTVMCHILWLFLEEASAIAASIRQF